MIVCYVVTCRNRAVMRPSPTLFLRNCMAITSCLDNPLKNLLLLQHSLSLQTLPVAQFTNSRDVLCQPSSHILKPISKPCSLHLLKVSRTWPFSSTFTATSLIENTMFSPWIIAMQKFPSRNHFCHISTMATPMLPLIYVGVLACTLLLIDRQWLPISLKNINEHKMPKRGLRHLPVPTDPHLFWPSVPPLQPSWALWFCKAADSAFLRTFPFFSTLFLFLERYVCVFACVHACVLCYDTVVYVLVLKWF